jgi:hypothetical protein
LTSQLVIKRRPYKLSFPQAKRVGNPSENKERFRTSRNDMDAECGFTGRINNLILLFFIAHNPSVEKFYDPLAVRGDIILMGHQYYCNI